MVYTLLMNKPTLSPLEKRVLDLHTNPKYLQKPGNAYIGRLIGKTHQHVYAIKKSLRYKGYLDENLNPKGDK